MPCYPVSFVCFPLLPFFTDNLESPGLLGFLTATKIRLLSEWKKPKNHFLLTSDFFGHLFQARSFNDVFHLNVGQFKYRMVLDKAHHRALAFYVSIEVVKLIQVGWLSDACIPEA